MRMKLVNNYECTMFPDVRDAAGWPSHVIPDAARFGTELQKF